MDVRSVLSSTITFYAYRASSLMLEEIMVDKAKVHKEFFVFLGRSDR